MDQELIYESTFNWAQTLRQINNNPFCLNKYPYLHQIYKDPSREIAIRKSAQVGISEYAINWTLFHLDLFSLLNKKANALYFFPSAQAAYDFSRTRFSKALQSSEYLAGIIQEDSHTIKRIRNNYLYLGGLNTERTARTIDADILIYDEFSDASMDIYEISRERISASQIRKILYLSTPTFPGSNIDKVFQDSKQYFWTMKCKCQDGFTVENSWTQHPLTENLDLICPKCNQVIDTTIGQWVPKQPNHERAGYTISQLLSPYCNRREIYRLNNTPGEIHNLYNQKLGLPYVDSTHSLTEDVILAAMTEEPPEYKYKLMGVDVQGNYLVYAIMTETGHAMEWGILNNFEDLARYISNNNIYGCVIDEQPERHSVRELMKTTKLPGRILPCRYVPGEGTKKFYSGLNSYVQTNRTEAFDKIIAEIRNKTITFKQTDKEDPLVKHFTNIHKKISDQQGKQRADWVKTGPDDYVHAVIYARIAKWICIDSAPKIHVI